MTILETLIYYHNILVEILLAVVVLNFIPLYAFKKEIKAIKWSRVGFFSFWGAWAMAFFTGLVVWVTIKFKIKLSIIAMLVAIVLLGILDGYRAIKLTKLWRSGILGSKFNTTIILIEIAIIAITTVVAVKF